MDFGQIAFLLVVAAFAGVAAKLIRQPLIIGYLISGVVVGSLGLVGDAHELEALGKIGVTLLLFLVGLEMNLSELPSVGKVAIVAGLGQIIFTSVFGFLIATALGYGALTAIYLAVALTFSSTIIIIKLLSEKNDLGSLYGKVSIGFLLVQDLVAILILMFLSALKTETFSSTTYLFVVLKAVALIVVVWLLAKKVFPILFGRLVDYSTELLFVVSIAWALGLSALVGGPLGFSPEIGGFLAGLSLSTLPDHLQISSRTRPLRDFFLTLFFVILGTNFVISDAHEIVLPAIIFSTFVLIGNPLIVMVLLGIMGYRKRTSFLASVTVAQISEFSLILMAMGVSLAHVTDSEVALVVVVGVITMTASTYLILQADRIFKVIAPFLSIFERKSSHEISVHAPVKKTDHVVLVGSHRTGTRLLSTLKKGDNNYVVVDFNPNTANRLSAAKMPVIFGDITDSDILESANVAEAKLVVSTTSDMHDNLVLLGYIKSKKSKAITILKSATKLEAIKLYANGADYVLVPEVLAGEHIRHVLKTYGVSAKTIHKLGVSHLKRLKKL